MREEWRIILRHATETMEQRQAGNAFNMRLIPGASGEVSDPWEGPFLLTDIENGASATLRDVVGGAELPRCHVHDLFTIVRLCPRRHHLRQETVVPLRLSCPVRRVRLPQRPFLDSLKKESSVVDSP